VTDIAVVVPFRGRWDSVVPTLEALSAQSVRSRITVVLSVDGLAEPPDEVKKLTDLCVNGKQNGPASARNRGWRSSSCPVVLFTDADCLPEPAWAERLAGKLEEGYQAVKGVYLSGGSSLIQRLAQVEFEERYRLMSRAPVVYLADTYSAGFSRNWLEKLDGFNENFPLPEHEDVDLSWRLIEAGGKIAFVPDAGVEHVHRATWTAYFKLKFRRGKWRIMLVRKFPAMVVSDGYTPQTLKLQMLFSMPLLASLFAAPVFPVFTAVSALAFLLVCIPLIRTASATDRSIVPVVPVFALWRAVALVSGSVRGITSKRVV